MDNLCLWMDSLESQPFRDLLSVLGPPVALVNPMDPKQKNPKTITIDTETSNIVCIFSLFFFYILTTSEAASDDN